MNCLIIRIRQPIRYWRYTRLSNSHHGILLSYINLVWWFLGFSRVLRTLRWWPFEWLVRRVLTHGALSSNILKIHIIIAWWDSVFVRSLSRAWLPLTHAPFPSVKDWREVFQLVIIIRIITHHHNRLSLLRLYSALWSINILTIHTSLRMLRWFSFSLDYDSLVILFCIRFICGIVVIHLVEL